jgi:predicted lipoprotein with Yx(FWY)xxD motif
MVVADDTSRELNMRRTWRLMAVGAALALVLSACGGDDDDNVSAANNTTTSAAASSDKTSATTTPAAGSDEGGQQSDVTVAYGETSLGDTLVDGAGMTLYIFDADTSDMSTCTDACAENWPPLVVTGQPVLGDGLDSSLFATSARPDGGTQLTVDGHPLYTFKGDTKPGDTNGQGVLDKWYAAGIDGSKLGDADAGATETTAKQSSSGGGGY